MKFSKIFVITIFLLFNENSYSLKCYTGMSSHNSTFSEESDNYQLKECSANYCRSIIGLSNDYGRMYMGFCDKANTCFNVSKVDIVLYLEDFAMNIGLPTNNIPSDYKKVSVNTIDECCNTDFCNAKEKTSYKTATVAREIRATSVVQPNNKEYLDVSAEPQTNNNVLNKSESIFHFFGYITLFCAFFIAELYKF